MAKLFAEFPEVTTPQWEAVINADLKGADYEKKLVWKTIEGFSVRPYYRAEDLSNVRHLGAQPGQFPYVRGTKCDNKWLVRQTIVVECPLEANKIALDVLTRGVESLCFSISNKEFSAADLDTLLDGIVISAVELNFEGCAVNKIAELFIDKIEKSNLTSEEVAVSFNIDPIVKKLSLKGKLCNDNGCCMSDAKSLIERSKKFGRIRFVTVNGQVFNSCGATSVQELAFALAVGHDYIVKLMDAGVSIDAAAHNIKFNMAIGSNYFIEIAKFRAARMLWANIVKKYNPTKDCASKMKVHAITSKFNITAYDPYVNMLRGTTESMSAAIAGVSSIEVLPFDTAFQAPSEFSSRIARNAQLLLKDESHFDQVTDVAGGSYYVETLTQSIADAAWSLFKAVEAEGGYVEAFKKGFIQTKVEEAAAKRDINIATRREILLGTNQYPNFNEKADKAVTEATVTKGACCCSSSSCSGEAPYRKLQPYRASMAFEQLRLNVDNHGKAVKAFMLTVGSLAFCRARAQFASNFFGCAGIDAIDNIRFSSVKEGVDAALEAKADIVVICSSDDEYQTLAPEAAEMLKGKALFVVAGEPACKAELQAKGINNFISVKSNVLETLKGYVKELGI
ncbi:MAG: methylmalonyl-CoA mutase family protein [Rikenellaceae bacterium]